MKTNEQLTAIIVGQAEQIVRQGEEIIKLNSAIKTVEKSRDLFYNQWQLLSDPLKTAEAQNEQA